MPKSKKFSKESLPLEIQAQLHKKTWVKTEHDKAVQVHHDNIDRVRNLESRIVEKLRRLASIGDSIDLLKSTAERWQYDEFSDPEKAVLARVNHLPVEDIEVCDPAECQMYRYTDGASILVDKQIEICKTISDIQADIDSNSLDASVERMWRDSNEVMLGKKYDRLVKKGEITPPATQEIQEEES